MGEWRTRAGIRGVENKSGDRGVNNKSADGGVNTGGGDGDETGSVTEGDEENRGPVSTPASPRTSGIRRATTTSPAYTVCRAFSR